MAAALYNFCIPLVMAVVRTLALIFPKLGAAIEERKTWQATWRSRLAKVPKERRILIHVSSVGELEQIRPVLEQWRAKENRPFLLSYFSPSVAKLVRDFSFVDAAACLPFDDRAEMAEFFALLEPSAIVLNRYDLWPNFFAEAKRRQIPIALINASLPPRGLWGKLSLALRASLLRQLAIWAYVDSFAASAWERFVAPGTAAMVSGDPRVDRALTRAREGKARREMERISACWAFDRERLIVAGSTWPADHELLLPALREVRSRPETESAKLVLVPHEPTRECLQSVERELERHKLSAVRLSALESAGKAQSAEVLLVDALGILAELYCLGAVAYVGGGFGRCIHSIIEPAGHGLAVAFGPRHQRVPEAKTMILLGAAQSFASPVESRDLANWFVANMRGGARFQKGRDAVEYFMKMHKGAGERTAEFLVQEFAKVARRTGSGGRNSGK